MRVFILFVAQHNPLTPLRRSLAAAHFSWRTIRGMRSQTVALPPPPQGPAFAWHLC
jgi:hypothetical protein